MRRVLVVALSLSISETILLKNVLVMMMLPLLISMEVKFPEVMNDTEKATMMGTVLIYDLTMKEQIG